MGIYGDDDEVVGSIFTDSVKHYSVPTYADRMMLRILYDPRLEYGMEKAVAMPIVREILSELRPYAD